MKAQMTAARPIEAQVIHERANGTGGVVRVPLARVHDRVDFSLTEGGGPEDGSVTRDMLQEMVANFGLMPRSVGISAGDHQADRSGPQPGFIDALFMVGDVLMADVDLGPNLFREVVVERSWRNTSLEARRNLETPTAKLQGWVLTGAVFTNQSALDTHFRIAAAGQETDSGRAVIFGRTRPTQAKEDDDMAEQTKTPASGEAAAAEAKTVSLSFHETKLSEAKDNLAAKQAEVDRVSAALSGARDELAALRAKHADAEQALAAATDEKAAAVARAGRLEAETKGIREANRHLTQQLEERTLALKDAEQVNLSEKVRVVIREALDAGVPAALFEGHKDNPAEWMNAQFTSLSAFEAHCRALSGVSKSLKSDKAVKSGHDPSKSEETPDAALGAKDQARFDRRFPGGAKFQGVTNEAEARERLKATTKAADSN